MEQTETAKKTGTLMPHRLVVGLIFLSLVVFALSVLSGYLCYQLKDQQLQFNALQKQVNRQSLEQTESTLIRQERGLDGQYDGRDDRDGRDGGVGASGRPGTPNRSFVSSIAFIHWGERTCPSRSGSMFEGVEGTIAGYHDQGNNIVAGSDVFCVTNSNDIDTHGQASNGLKLQPAEFNLYGHSQHFPYYNKKGFLYCNHCFVEASDVITLIGRSCPNPEWRSLYSGFMTTSFSVFGTSQSICVASNALPVSNNLFFSSSRSMSPAMSGSVSSISTSSNKIIPCSVCYRKPGESLLRSQGREGPVGSTGANGADRGIYRDTGLRGTFGARGNDGAY